MGRSEIDVVKFLKECQKTHTEWAECFERDPEMEKVYVGSGEWEDAAAHRRLEKQYEQVIQKYLDLERLGGIISRIYKWVNSRSNVTDMKEAIRQECEQALAGGKG